jgi:hypothetical protein
MDRNEAYTSQGDDKRKDKLALKLIGKLDCFSKYVCAELGLERADQKRKWLDEFQKYVIWLHDDIQSRKISMNDANKSLRSCFALPAMYFHFRRVPLESSVYFSHTPLDDLRFCQWGSDELERWHFHNNILYK